MKYAQTRMLRYLERLTPSVSELVVSATLMTAGVTVDVGEVLEHDAHSVMVKVNAGGKTVFALLEREQITSIEIQLDEEACAQAGVRPTLEAAYAYEIDRWKLR